MKKLLILFALTFGGILHGQLAEQWQQMYGGPGVEKAHSVRSCPDQGYIVVGSGSSAGPSDGQIIRTDSLGLVLWNKFYGGNNIDVIRSVEILPDSGFIMAGFTNSFGAGGYDGWVLRADKFGDTLWTRTIGTIDWDFFYDVTCTWDSGFVLAGGTYGMGQGDEDMWFVKIDANGNTEWVKTCGGIKMDEAKSVAETSDSMLVACGITFSLSDSLGESWILRLSGINGDTIWTRTAGYTGAADCANAVGDYAAPDWIYFCGGREITPGNSDAYFGIFNYAGVNLLQSSTGGAQDEMYNDLVTRPDGAVATIGSNYTAGAGAGDMYLFHSVGVWPSYTFGTPEPEEGYGVDVTNDGGYILCGYTEGFNAFVPNFYLVKTDSACYSPTLLNVRENIEAQATAVTTAFPNPASANIQINYDAAHEITNDLTIRIYDVFGQLVMEQNSQEWTRLSAYSMNTSLDISGMVPGVYTYTVSDGIQSIATNKFIVAN